MSDLKVETIVLIEGFTQFEWHILEHDNGDGDDSETYCGYYFDTNELSGGDFSTWDNEKDYPHCSECKKNYNKKHKKSLRDYLKNYVTT